MFFLFLNYPKCNLTFKIINKSKLIKLYLKFNIILKIILYKDYKKLIILHVFYCLMVSTRYRVLGLWSCRLDKRSHVRRFGEKSSINKQLQAIIVFIGDVPKITAIYDWIKSVKVSWI
jgi:hypothetical protein